MSLPYTSLGNITGSLYSGSFLNEQDTILFSTSQSSDIWFGLSENDVIEFSAYDPNDESLVVWSTLDQDKTFTTNTLTYLDALNVPKSFTYKTLDNPFILYKNKSILVNAAKELNDVGIFGGSYKVSYAFSRNMAGSPTSPLSIKDISPSRTEIKLIPQGGNNIQYTAFCQKKFPIRDVAPVLISITQRCPYDQIYSIISKNSQYKAGIDYLKFVFFLQDDGSVINFLKNLYEDYIKYTRLTDSQINSGLEPTRITRIQGIQSYFSNYLLSSFELISDFDLIEQKFGDFVNLRLDQIFGAFKNSQSEEYKQARQFCYDYFFKYYYEPSVHLLQQSHQLKYFSYLKNVLNFGSNKYFTILDHEFLDERINPTDPLTLVVKLSTSLPNDIASKESCWISNYGMAPFILTIILQNPIKYKTIKISAPNFGATSQFITPENINKLYSSEDLTFNTSVEDNITINKNISSLNTDYSSFENFVVFSSADTRLGIFENKVKSWTVLSSSLCELEFKYLTSLSSSTLYPYYLNEKSLIEEQMTELVDSFDGYESYLFYSGNYQYSVVSSSFVSSSYVLNNRELAQAYDTNNKDNLLSNTPEYIVRDSNNSEYLTFLQMVGHHFDNIYTYISALPIERQLQNEVSSSIPTSTLKQMLSSAGWEVEDIIGSLDIDEVYLNSLDGSSYNTISSERRLQIIWNRILVTLPGIYKTKGTEECVKYLLSCYGLPSSLITIREYGGTDYSEESEPTYKLDEKTFLMRFSGVSDYVEGPIPQSVKTVEFKFAVEESDVYTNRIYYPLFKSIAYPNTDQNLSAWSIGITKLPGQFMGQVEFRMESGSITSNKITSSTLPIFNGQIFSVMVRGESVSEDFDYTDTANIVPRTYDLVVQRNEDGRKIFYSTSSAIFYDGDNAAFAKYGRFRFGNGSPGGTFIGAMDKLSIWDVPIDNSSWEEHVNDINSFGLSGSNVYKNLWVRLGVDYPVNLYTNLNGSSSIWVDNQSPYYAIPNYYIGNLSGSIDTTLYSASLDIIENRWATYYPTGSVEIIAHNFPPVMSSNFTTSYDCGWNSGSSYPYHYREYTYQQDIDASKYGPNKFKNKKIRKVDYSVEARFDVEDKSTNLINSTISGESNQIGFFIDPQDHKNKDIIRYVGKCGIMDLIADPSNIYEARYSDLINKNKEYNSIGNKQTYFNEMLTLYKFYFDKSIFQAIKNVLPARANVFTGVVIEPTILERPKYQNRPLVADITTDVFSCDINPIKNFSVSGLWTNFNINYFDGNAQLMTTQSMALLQNSMPPNYLVGIDLADLNNPTVGFKDNLHCHYIDSPDKIQFTNFADFESYPRLWEVTPDAVPGWPTNPIYGSTTHDDMNDLFVVGPDQNQILRTSDPTTSGYNTGSHQILYYMLKVWEKYSYFYKTGPYHHSDIPTENTHASNSVYLYKYITVSEPFLRRYLYWYNQVPLVGGNNDPSPLYSGGQYIHSVNTFIGTPDLSVSNVYAYGIDNFSHTYTSLAFRPDNRYFELVRGYPRNHYTHKLLTFSPTQYTKIYNSTNNVIFIKGRNTIDTTISETGINDGTLPVQSFNTSNINVVNSTNVIQSGITSGAGATVPIGSSGINTGGTATTSTAQKT